MYDTIAADIAAGLERMALDDAAGIRPRATAASRLLELTGVDPADAPQLPCDPLPEPCRRMKPDYRTLREWARRGYIASPILWKSNRVRWTERSCVHAVVLAKLLRRGLRGDGLPDVVRRTRRTPAVELARLARDSSGVDELIGAATETAT